MRVRVAYPSYAVPRSRSTRGLGAVPAGGDCSIYTSAKMRADCDSGAGMFHFHPGTTINCDIAYANNSNQRAWCRAASLLDSATPDVAPTPSPVDVLCPAGYAPQNGHCVAIPPPPPNPAPSAGSSPPPAGSVIPGSGQTPGPVVPLSPTQCPSGYTAGAVAPDGTILACIPYPTNDASAGDKVLHGSGSPILGGDPLFTTDQIKAFVSSGYGRWIALGIGGLLAWKFLK